MNKADLVAAVAAKADITKVDAKKAVDAIIAISTEALKAGDKVTLVGFGTFAVVERGARVGRNPRTGSAIKIGPKKVVKFRPGAELGELD